MKRIKLTQGYFALVDDRDFKKLSKFKWWALVDKSGAIYACRTTSKPDGKKTSIRMGRQVMNAPKGKDTDHKDRNTLNNQRSNLRVCTRSQNNANSKKRKDNTSGIKGVSWDYRTRKWIAQIQLRGKNVFFKRYTNKLKAATAYAIAAKKYFGEFVRVR